jgi:proteasome lid subunit RPN8/RPN11
MITWLRRKMSRGHEPTVLPPIWISSQVLNHTVDVLRASGDRHEAHEGIAYWAGRRAAGETFVTTCIAPAARTTYGSFDTSAHTNAKVVMLLARTGLELIGQVHSHPGGLVDHSDGDDERALMPYEGFLSLVVPHYAKQGMLPLTICGVHVFRMSRFCRLGNPEIETRFHLIDDFADLRS